MHLNLNEEKNSSKQWNGPSFSIKFHSCLEK